MGSSNRSWRFERNFSDLREDGWKIGWIDGILGLFVVIILGFWLYSGFKLYYRYLRRLVVMDLFSFLLIIYFFVIVIVKE